MYCRSCGVANDDNAYKCTQCGEILQFAQPTKIENNLVLAVIVTALCCMPFGIVGIVYATQVNAKAMAGDIAGAEECARKSRRWSLWGLGLGFVVIVAYLVLVVGAELAKR